MKDIPAFEGGCLCGAVRYTVAAGPGQVNLCFCNMCKQATGAPVPAFISVARDRVVWHGKPAVYQSSAIASRGFCGTCGSPLYYAGNDSSTFGFSMGCAKVAVAPDMVFYHDDHPAWLAQIDKLPRPDFQPAGRSDIPARDRF